MSEYTYIDHTGALTITSLPNIGLTKILIKQDGAYKRMHIDNTDVPTVAAELLKAAGMEATILPKSPYEVKESEFAPRCGRDGEGVVLRPGSTPEKLRNIAANFVALAEYLEAKESEVGEAA